MGHETMSALGFAATLDELYGLGFAHVEAYPSKIDSVTVEDLRQLAKTYLVPERAVVVLTRPLAREKK